MSGPTIVWLRRDLRLADNPALAAAARRGPVLPVYIDETSDPWPAIGAARERLQMSLEALQGDLRDRGSRLVLLRGKTEDALSGLITATGARGLYFNRRIEPWGREIDAACIRRFEQQCEVVCFDADVLFDPALVRTRTGDPYKVFTPFYRTVLRDHEIVQPSPAPARLQPPQKWPVTSTGENPGASASNWARRLRGGWQAGSAAAGKAVGDFLETGIERYPDRRDYPGSSGTSGLSAHLCWGEISPREVWHATHEAMVAHGTSVFENAANAWLRQLVWRDFARHILFHFPHTCEHPMRDGFAQLPWVEDTEALERWQRGRTGFPIVDAGMRQLWQTGRMHNRVRMLVASLLTKHIGTHWLHGARWFWDTLEDADLANNSMGWQWVAGCGADAAPYFRIFNPVTQGRKFDAEGAYIRRWVPELRKVDAKLVHEPGMLCADYPPPMLDLKSARQAALDRHAGIRGGDAS